MLDRQRIADLWWELMQIPRECFYADKPQHIPMNLTEPYRDSRRLQTLRG